MTWAQRSVSQCAELFSLRRHWHVRLGDVLLQLNFIINLLYYW
jgi:hypothetical protein